MPDLKRVLMVCSGNTCRSPMAAALLRKALVECHRENDVEVLSAGIGAADGDPAADNAVAVMRDRGLNLDDHRSRRLTGELLESADLVLTMTSAHKLEVLYQAPGEAARVFTLAEYAGRDNGGGRSPGDIADPINGSRAKYEETAARIEELLDLVIARWEREGWWDQECVSP